MAMGQAAAARTGAANAWGDAWRRLRRDRLALGALCVLGGLLAVLLAVPFLPLADPAATTLDQRLLPPLVPSHPLGTDQLGRDVLARLMWGARLSLGVAAVSVLIAAVLGSAIGLNAAYHGGVVDTVLMRFIDVLMAFPYLLLALAIVAALGPGLGNAAIAIAIVNVPFFARTVRGTTLAFVREDFVDTARMAGLTDARILVSELLPNVLPVIVVTMSTSFGWMILETAGLSFLGLGAQPPQADLGGLLGESRHLMATAPHLSIIPGLAILLVVATLNVAGDGLRDALDPRAARASSARGAARIAPPRELRSESSPEGTSGRSREPAVLAIEDLRVAAFGDEGESTILDGVALAIARGESVGLVGESGSGKSVTALSVLGLLGASLRIVGGRISFAGDVVLDAQLDERRRLRGRRIGYVPQDPVRSLHPLFTVGDQIAETLRIVHGWSADDARERAVELLEQVGIDTPEERVHAYPHQLSGGMRQRVAIAIAIAGEPELLIADEPTTALDVTTQAQILARLRALVEERDSAMLFISHDIAVVSQVCERMLVMYRGELVEEGPTARVLDRPADEYTGRLIASLPRFGEGAAPEAG